LLHRQCRSCLRHDVRAFDDGRLIPAVVFFPAAATPEIYTLSLHDALPISPSIGLPWASLPPPKGCKGWLLARPARARRARLRPRSEEHTSELQSRENLVCRLLLEKKKHDGLEVAGVDGRHAVVGGLDELRG